MFQACRPAGRLFYLVLALVVAATSVGLSASVEASAGRGEAGECPSGEGGRQSHAACGFAGSPERTGADERDRHRVHGGWNSGAGRPGHYVAGVCGSEWDGGGSGGIGCDAGNERRIECGAGGERGSESSGRVLHRGVPVGTGRGANGVLGGADEFSGNPGGGADDAGIRNGGATGVDAVCEFGSGDEGE